MKLELRSPLAIVGHSLVPVPTASMTTAKIPSKRLAPVGTPGKEQNHMIGVVAIKN